MTHITCTVHAIAVNITGAVNITSTIFFQKCCRDFAVLYSLIIQAQLTNTSRPLRSQHQLSLYSETNQGKKKMYEEAE